MSVRLAKAMPYTSPEFWLKMQLNYDLWRLRIKEAADKPLSAQPQKHFASDLT